MNTDITVNEMIDLYGDSEWMRNFSHDAKTTILNAFKSYQKFVKEGLGYNSSVTWETFFLSAVEFTKAEIKDCSDDIESYTHKIELNNGNLLCMK